MKIFVPGPESDDTFSHNVAHALRAMGHDVRTGPSELFTMRKSPARRGLEELLLRGSARFRMRRDARVVAIAREFKPDLTVICTGTLEPEAIAQIRRASGGKVICWYGDPPANLRRDHLVSGEYDALFVKDEDFAGRLRSVLGLEAFHLAEACNPEWHRPVATRAGEAVLLAGTAYGYRNTLIGRLLDAGQQVELYGPKPSAWVPARIAAVHTGRFLDHQTKAEAFGRAMACLNNFTPAECSCSVNCRVFETCGSGGLLLTEARSSIEAYFEPGTEYLPFHSFEECLDHLRRVQKDYRVAERIRERAARRAHAEHTYEHRLIHILRTIDMA